MSEQNGGIWDGAAGVRDVDFLYPPEADKIIVLAQKGKTGPIKGAGMLDISGN
ncbi:MAG: hypothetical protein LRZ85_01760 [Alphaproteobacteria bacterium]|nr:hypothetical protein [Alphaproteobacteria bacterium]MCD8526512.1 hypothetical protein [Alphaproteobacteria bacterium]MCD8570349.1 hypothetical protein [Alphaproteobacteria bacterium]